MYRGLIAFIKVLLSLTRENKIENRYSPVVVSYMNCVVIIDMRVNSISVMFPTI
jgi:hypothetical protein